MNELIQLKTITLSFLIAFLLSCVAISPKVQALAPPPDGGYAGANTAEGDGALNSVIPQARGSGANNTALGYHTLFSDTSGSFNTATGSVALANNNGSNNTANGYQALADNTNGSYNTATGSQALTNNTASFNSAFGGLALFSNISGSQNSAVGWGALRENIYGFANTAVGYNALTNNLGTFPPPDPNIGSRNTAVGSEALYNNTNGHHNTAIGSSALFSNTTSIDNVALGSDALYSNMDGDANTAIGVSGLLHNTTGIENTAIGPGALSTNTTGNSNIALGYAAGLHTTGSFNIDIGNEGVAGESNTIRIGTEGLHTVTLIAGIWGTPIVGGATVVVNGNGQLGVAAIASSLPGSHSTRRLRQEMLRYEAMNMKLESNFLKEHRKVEEQQATITELKKEMKAILARVNEQESRIQKVSAELELRKAAPQMVVDNSVKTQDLQDGVQY
jgi:hypothetical protein